jgi:hypothetical protein
MWPPDCLGLTGCYWRQYQFNALFFLATDELEETMTLKAVAEIAASLKLTQSWSLVDDGHHDMYAHTKLVMMSHVTC